MAPFEIFFHNNGSATFQTENFCHHYDCMQHMASDFVSYQNDKNTDGWEGNDPEFRVEYDSEIERNGGYFCVTDLCWNDLDSKKSYNVSEFISALSESGVES